jgi:undecaprenyl-diphosphatase
MNWFQSLLLGLLSGLAEILPVSAHAHRLLMLKLFGSASEPALLRLMIHLGTLASLYYSLRNHIVRMTRAQRLSRIPKKRRKRPLDTKALADYRLLKTTLIPLIIGFLFYGKTAALGSKLLIVSAALIVNGLIVYIPQFIPGSTRESDQMFPVDGLLLGLGGALSTIPGLSAMGLALSIASVRGMEKKTALNIALLMNIPVVLGLTAHDVISILTGGMSGVSVGLVFSSILAAAAAFSGVFLGIKLLRKVSDTIGYAGFGFYCWGTALFTFFIFLTAA